MPFSLDLAAVRLVSAQLLRFVRHARVELTVPLAPGTLLPGLQVMPGTTASVEVTVREGAVDLANARIQLLPPLDGPLFTRVDGLGVGADGRATLRVTGLPDVKLGPRLPAALSEIADGLERADSTIDVGVRVFGIRLGSVEVSGAGAVEAAQQLARGDAPGSPVLERARLGLLDVELQPGALELLPGVSARLAEGCAFRLSGTAERMEINGRLALEGVQLHAGQLTVEDGEGSANVRVELDRRASEGWRWSARFEDALVRTGHAHVPGRGEDFLRFDALSVEGGLLELRDQRALNLDDLLRGLSFADTHLHADHFDAQLSAGFITVAREGERSSDVVLARSRLSGTLTSERGEAFIAGDLELDTRIRELHSPGESLALVLADSQLSGGARVRLSLDEGLHLRGGELRLVTAIEHARVRAMEGRLLLQAVQGSTADVAISTLLLTREGDLRLEGEGVFNFRMGPLELPVPQLELLRHDGKVRAQGAIMLDTRDGIELSDGKVLLEAEPFDASIQVGGRARLRADGHYKLKASSALVSVRKQQVRLAWGEGSTLSAELQRGTVMLPGGAELELRRGTRVAGKIARLEWTSKSRAHLEASGKLHVFLASERDLAEGARLFRVAVSRLSAGPQELEVSAGRLGFHEGRFHVEDVQVGFTAHVEDLTGTWP